MKGRRPALGADPLDAIVPAAAAEPPPVRPPKRVRVSYDIPPELADRVRDVAVGLSGPPLRLTLGALAEQALLREVERLEAKHNEGRRFPRVSGKLKGGRPIGS